MTKTNRMQLSRIGLHRLREQDLKRGPLPRTAFYGDSPTVGCDQLLDDSQPQSQSVAGPLEKTLEDMGKILIGNAGTIIGYLQADRVFLPGGDNRHAAAAVDRLERVGHQIDDDLAHTVRVGPQLEVCGAINHQIRIFIGKQPFKTAGDGE